MDTKKVIEIIEKGDFDEKFVDIYVDEEQLEYQKKRYIQPNISLFFIYLLGLRVYYLIIYS